MKDEISAAVSFICKMLDKNTNVNKDKIKIFAQKLTEILQEKFFNHWHIESPWRGQAYRCLR